MKTSIALSSVVALAAKTLALSCWSEKLGYPCCSSKLAPVIYTDDDGNWGVENNEWCGIPIQSICWSEDLGYPCCKSTTRVEYSDNDGNWGVENGNWCGITIHCCLPPYLRTPSIPEKPEKEYEHNGNPFKGHKFYINPYYEEEVDYAITQMSDPKLILKAEKMKEYSNAIWLDTIQNMNLWLEKNLNAAYIEQESTNQTVLTVFVVYNLPGRDCNHYVSNGELLPNDSDFERYKSEYIDVIYDKLAYYKSQPVVLVIEPNALPSLISRLDTDYDYPLCKESEKYYMNGHAYLINKLGQLKNVAMYLDIGFAYWLGWDDHRVKAAELYSNVIKSGSPGKVRGFASNIANYMVWMEPEHSRGPDYEWFPCRDERNYIKLMYEDFKAAGIESVYFIEDTSRNGVENDRFHPQEWCNVSGSGVGPRPQANPVRDMEYLDAFYWIKPYGESDGTSDETSPRYDKFCGHRTSMKSAPEYGQWFQAYFEEGLRNAYPPL